MAKLKKIFILILIIYVINLIIMAIPNIFGDDAELLGELASPGDLSPAHQFLQNDCAACHTPHKGVQDSSCILCHANAKSILQRQPTAFHADIGNCATCHKEHMHPHSKMTEMDHSLLADIGMEQLLSSEAGSESRARSSRLEHWMKDGNTIREGSHISAKESTLNCATCHSNDDRHFDLFGQNCASCHSTKKWSIPKFKHPSSKSHNCAQCHQAPPSHYMMHFKMISAKVAGKPHAKVSQCYSCHQTTSWTDILGKGTYKHH